MTNQTLTPDEQKRFFIISGHSGVGKGTVIAEMMRSHADVAKIITHNTRQPRTGEVNGVDRFFVSEEEFSKLVKENYFLEHNTVYGHSYGSSFDNIKKNLSEKSFAVIELDIQGARAVKEKYPNIISIFITAENIEEIEKRIRARGKDDEETIRRRLSEIKKETEAEKEYNYIIVNREGAVAAAAEELYEIIHSHGI